MDLPGMSMPAPRIFAPDLIWTTAGDTVLVLNGPDYRIEAYAEGRPIGSIRRDVTPIAVTDEMAAARVGSGTYRGFIRRAGVTAEQMVAAVGYEELASPIEWIAAHPSGDLWVSRGSGRPVPDRVDVFASEGRYLGTFATPGFPVAFLSDSLFVALEITEMGEPVLGLYRHDGQRVRVGVRLLLSRQRRRPDRRRAAPGCLTILGGRHLHGPCLARRVLGVVRVGDTVGGAEAD